MRYFLISLLVAGCAWGQVTVQTNRLGALTKNSMIVTGMTFNAGQVTGIPHETNATAHASLFGETVKTNQTITINGITGTLKSNLTFTVVGGVTNNQSSVSLTNFTANGYFSVTAAVMYRQPIGQDFRRRVQYYEHTADRKLNFMTMTRPSRGEMLLGHADPSTDSLWWGQLPQDADFTERRTNSTVASLAWVTSQISGGVTEATVTNISEAVVAPYTNSIATAWQNPAYATNFLWSSDGVSVSITDYTGEGGSVVIPDYLDGLPVTDFGFAFYENIFIEQISGGKNVTNLYYCSFLNCTNLASVKLDSVIDIGLNAFENCTRLSHVELKSAVFARRYAFLNCTNLTSVILPSVENAGSYAFLDCESLEVLVLPSLTNTFFYSFANCSKLREVKINNIITLGEGAFADCPLLSNVEMFNVKWIGPAVFMNCTNIFTLELNRVTDIFSGAFSGCLNLQSLYYNGDVPDVGMSLFLDVPANQVTNYVTNPTATGWGATFGGMPVVRMPVTADSITLGGVSKSAWPAASSGVPAVWTNMTWGAVGTNSTYRMSWDVTNGTFKIEEILP